MSFFFAVGPPYTLRLRVKFYASEPNNLHEELTRYVDSSQTRYVDSSQTRYVDRYVTRYVCRQQSN